MGHSCFAKTLGNGRFFRLRNDPTPYFSSSPYRRDMGLTPRESPCYAALRGRQEW
jgi:hypothetical protein